MGGLYEGIAGMFKNITFKRGDIDLSTVVAKVVRPDGTVANLRHCGDLTVVNNKNHRENNSPIIVKPKTKGQFAVEFICVGTHRANFAPQNVFIEAKRSGRSERIQSKPFFITGSRDKNKTSKIANKLHEVQQQIIQPVPPTIQNNEIADLRANPPPTISLDNESDKELFAPLQNSTDPGNQVQVENSDYQDIDTSTILDIDPYVDFMHSRFEN